MSFEPLAYAADQWRNAIEFFLSICCKDQSRESSFNVECSNFKKVLEEINLILEETAKIKTDCLEENVPAPDYSDSATSSRLTLTATNTMVGDNDDLMEIQDRLYQDVPQQLQVIPISGMGGIGKTTLARRLYEDSMKAQHFDVCVWIVVSQEYSLREILLQVLKSIKDTADLHQKSPGELRQHVHKALFGRRYLVVVDDVWSLKAWDDLYQIFPKDNNGSRILVTTRLVDVAAYAGSSPSLLHEMHFLNEDQSWSLLQERVFRQEPSCPSHLENIGKKIARLCRGLPLTITVVAGLISENMTPEYWESISQSISSEESTIALHCTKVLSLSYDHLPIYLKPCFLYVTAFPEDFAIPVNHLVWLWMAEGFVKPCESKCLEEVGEAYVEDLVRRSLLMVAETRPIRRIEAVRVHDVLRNMGTVKAQEGKFLYHHHAISGSTYSKLRRLSTTDKSFSCLENIDDPKIRTLLIFAAIDFPSFIPKLRLLRIFGALRSEQYPINICDESVYLRYLDAKCDKLQLPPTTSKLRNLETLIVRGEKLYIYKGRIRIPLEVWKMPSLRHLILRDKCYLEHPSNSEMVEATNLHTLSVASDLRLTKQVIKMLGNLRKLGLNYAKINQDGCNKFELSNLIHLMKLQELKIVNQSYGTGVPAIRLAFPPSIKKLTLDDASDFWGEIDIVGCFPNLEVLKLKRKAFIDRYWYPIESQFPELKHLEISSPLFYKWIAESIHFPKLESLTLKNAGYFLKEIPSGIGEIDTLKLIGLYNCESSIVDSAKEILAERRDMADDEFQLIVNDKAL